MGGGVGEGVGGVGGDAESFAGFYDGFCVAEGGLDFAFQDGEGFFEVVAVWGWAAAGGDMHVDEAVAAAGVFAGEQNCVGVADEADVGRLAGVGMRDGEGSVEVVGWDCGLGVGLVLFKVHDWAPTSRIIGSMHGEKLKSRHALISLG